MNFERRYDFGDTHAFLSPSNYHWINYDAEKLASKFNNFQAAAEGTRRHEFAREAIELGIKQVRTQKTLNMFINDAIGFRMSPEQPLFYSENCFGTVDAISFNRNFLRIHDLKTGTTKCSMIQLEIYAALFCLEYDVNPNDIDIELRIYQNDEIKAHIPEEIADVMEIIVRADKEIMMLKKP
jgi:hypothetical protein